MTRIKYILTALGLVMSLSSTQAAEKLYDFHLNKSDLPIVLNLYGGYSGKRVEVVTGVNAQITISAEKVTNTQRLELINEALKDQGIDLFEISSNRVVATWIESQATIDDARKYLAYCRETKTLPRLEGIKWEERLKYFHKVPELQALQVKARKSSNVISNMVMQDEIYQTAVETFRSSTGEGRTVALENLKSARIATEKKLQEESEEYRKAIILRDESIYNANIQTLEFIINDYEKRGRFFPFLEALMN